MVKVLSHFKTYVIVTFFNGNLGIVMSEQGTKHFNECIFI